MKDETDYGWHTSDLFRFILPPSSFILALL
jgi:hypothetical protein